MRRAALLAPLSCVAILAFASAASAADSVYWSNTADGTLGRAALTGGEGAVLSPAPVPAEEPSGSAIDAQTGKVFWGDFHSNTIKDANLDGSASAVLPTGEASVDGPNSPVVDLATGRIYWANAKDDTIAWANLDGSGGGNLNTGTAPVEEPWGIAIDPTANRIYWANFAGDSIAYANLDGSGGGGQVPLSASYAEEPDGVAVDQEGQRVYWTNFEGGSTEGSIAWANLAYPEAGLVPVPAGFVVKPGGLAIGVYPRIGRRIYWTNEGGDEGVFSAWAEGQEAVRVDPGGATLAGPSAPSLFVAPSLEGAIGLPGLTHLTQVREASLGATLSCDSPKWAADSVETHLYRAPQTISFGWTFEDVWLGVTSETVTAAQPGRYACHVTATNGAGSTTVTTATYGVPHPRGPATTTPQIERVKVTRDKRSGTATLLITVSGPGTLSVGGRQVVHRTADTAAAGTVKLMVAARGKALRNLKKTGKRTVEAGIEFATASGHFVTSRSITLRRPARLPRHH